MGLRPRTARRLALAGAIVFLLVLAAAVAFTLPKFQNRRQIEGFQRDGLLAHEEGRHGTAVVLLGRHLRGMGDRPVDPAVRLAFARSRAELEASDGGHLPAAITVYREYLREVSDDREASRELLGLFVRTGQWVEARELAGRLRASNLAQVADAELEVLRLEAVARLAINAADPLIEQLEDRLLGAEPPQFVDVWRAYTRAIAGNNPERADSIVSKYSESAPDSLGVGVMQAVVGSDGLSLDDAAGVVAGVLGLDAQTGADTRDVPLADDELSRAMVLLAGAWRQEPLVLGVLARAAASSNDPDFARLLARRRYWAGRGDDLLAQPTTTAGGGVVADVLGYAAMARFDRNESDEVETLLSQLRTVQDDFRAPAWVGILEARKQTESGKLVEARASATKAIEAYPFEPTFRYVLGDIHDRMGRLSEASDAWRLASELAGPGVWTAPETRRVLALLRAGRATEAGAAADEMVGTVRSTGGRRTIVEALIIQLQVNAQLAVLSQLDLTTAGESMQVARALRDSVPGPLRIDCMLHIAAFEAAVGNQDGARTELRAAIDAGLTGPQAGRAEEVDLAFGLGVFSAVDAVTLDPPPTEPGAAIRTVMVYITASESDAVRSDRVSQSLAFLADRIATAEPSNRAAWLRADAIVKSQIRHEGAGVAWRSALAASPTDLELLTEAIESEPLVYDRDFVESSLARITELTATQGRTLPSRLRLARARSIFGREPTRQSREEALLIVRAVVVAEPENVSARTVLGNMLQFPCPPQVQAPNRYERDLTGAVEQYLAAARLVRGRVAIGYLIQAASLSFEAGNEPQARQILLDVIGLSRTTPIAWNSIARDLTRFTDAQFSARLLEDMFASATGGERTDLGLFLVQTYLGSGDHARAAAVLDRIVASRPTLTAMQLADIASRFAQAGRPDRAEAVLTDVTGFGLQPRDAGRIRAEMAFRSRDLSEAIRILTDLTRTDPADASVWIALVEAMYRSGDSEGATEAADRALAIHPDDTDLQFWRETLSGNVADAVLRRVSASGQPQSIRLAIQRVEAYESKKQTLDRGARLAELKALRESFSGNASVLKYVFRERAELGDDATSLAADALTDHRRFADDEELLRFAAIAVLNAGRYDDAMRLATRLRGLSRGSTHEPDMIFVQAAQAIGNHAAVIDRLGPSVEAALTDAGNDISQRILFVHSRSAILAGLESAVRTRLEPLARSSPQFRSRVWLPLAAGSVTPQAQAESWMRSAEQMGLGGMEVQAAESWLALSERFPVRAEQFAANGVRLALAHLAQFPDDLQAVSMAAVASQRQAEAMPPETASDTFAQAEELFVRAATIQPENPNHLFTAAICADAAGRPSQAEQYYRTLLTRQTSNDLFTAAVRNNLAGILSRENPTPPRLAEALQFANAAVGFGDIGAFHGTRGWIHLAQANHEAAEADFRRVAQLDQAAVEGWLGLAAVLKASGRAESDVQTAIGRVRQATAGSPLSRELDIKAKKYGLEI